LDSPGAGFVRHSKIKTAKGAKNARITLEILHKPGGFTNGNWIASRGADNGRLYLIRMDGIQGCRLIEKPTPA